MGVIAVPPNETVIEAANPVPVTVTTWPPVAGRAAGASDTTTGNGGVTTTAGPTATAIPWNVESMRANSDSEHVY